MRNDDSREGEQRDPSCRTTAYACLNAVYRPLSLKPRDAIGNQLAQQVTDRRWDVRIGRRNGIHRLRSKSGFVVFVAAGEQADENETDGCDSAGDHRRTLFHKISCFADQLVNVLFL